jgi:hypothetical protein
VRVENKHDGYAPPWRPALTPPSWIDLRDQKFESGFLQRRVRKLSVRLKMTATVSTHAFGNDQHDGDLPGTGERQERYRTGKYWAITTPRTASQR